MKNEKNYLGFDIGTESVGWAVTDETYRLRKFKGNLMWGVHLFDEAKQSAERRTFRTARRRLDRRQQRIQLLQEFFESEILKKDEKFFLRLKESTLLPEDSKHRKHNIFFDDENYGDREYFKDYPSIHHLICELMSSAEPHDIRLVYYACSYILAHRGHFLFSVDKDNVEKITDFKPIYDNFYSMLEELCIALPFDRDCERTAEIMRSQISSNAKDKKLKELMFGGKAPKEEEDHIIRYDLLTKLISGGTVKLSELFYKDEYKELEKNSICVKNAEFSDTLDLLTGQIDELHLNLLASIKAIYGWSLLEEILSEDTTKYEVMGHKKTISLCKVAKFDRHKEDLKELKYFLHTYLTKEDYNVIFREISDKANYVSYVYNAPSDNARIKYKKCTQEEFCKFLKPYFGKISPSDEDKERFEMLKKKCDDSELCPKQVTTDNRVIPYQLYYAELKKILNNACGYLTFLNEKDENGTVADKIMKIMEFRIPYYVGPLVGNNKSKNAWLVRKAEGRIYPWNFSEKVDEDACEEEFIRRMTCKCTYIAGENVLPKYSLLYSKFMVLNEINSIKVNGEPISVDLKQKLYKAKFVDTRAKVTKKRIAEYFRSIGAYSGEIAITGVDDNIKSSLGSYHDFKIAIEGGLLTERDAEKIIERITVTNDTKRLKRWLEQNYPQLSDDDIKYFAKLKYNDYGRLSRRFLEDHFSDPETAEVLCEKNIISMLWDTNDALMQLLSSRYGYFSAIEKYNRWYYGQSDNNKQLNERLNEMYIPTAVRRSVTRTIDLAKELKTILGKAPDKIFIEMARETGDAQKGRRTESRKEQILRVLNDSDTDVSSEFLKQLDAADADGRLRGEKYFLYFMQLGKCAYTGKNISFEELGDNHKWNIDHIWPQSKVKDDSIENKVLVDSNANGLKGDSYPISSDIRNRMSGFWKALHDKKMMSEKKYHRLTRSTPFTEDELSGFIARQLVETRQSTKAVAELLKELFPDTDVVYVKAGLVSEFRQETGMLKCREINDLHHAKDAYLNIVMGNIYDTRFTKSPLNFVRKNANYSIKLTTLISQKIERNFEVAWDPDSSFKVVRDMMSKNSIRYVRYCYKRKSGQNGGFFDQNPLRKGKGMVQIKDDLPIEKYGGFDNATISFFCIAVVKGKGAVLAAVELLFADRFLNDDDFAHKYIADKLSSVLKSDITPEDILLPFDHRVIKINTILEIDGYRVMIAAKQNTSIKFVSAESLILDDDDVAYVKKIYSYIEKSKADKSLKIGNYSGLNFESNFKLFDTLTNKCISKPFSKMYKDLGEKMRSSKEKFADYQLEEQVRILAEMVALFKTGRKNGVDLSAVGGKSHSGVKSLNTFLFKINDHKTIRIIDQSPTGLYEKKSVNLLEL